MERSLRPAGSLSVRKMRLIERPFIRNLSDAIRYGTPERLPRFGRGNPKARWQLANSSNFERSLHDQAEFDAGRLFAIGHLWLAHFRNDGTVQDLGLASCRVVTDAGVGFIVDAFQGLTTLSNMKYHGLGTGGTAEAASQTALTTELTTQYSTSNTRPTGTTAEAAANIYQTVATITVSATVAATEHGIFSQAATGGGVLLDRTLFSTVNLASGESLQSTYQLTFPSGS